MGAFESLMLFIAKYILPVVLAVVGWLYKDLKEENKQMGVKLDLVKERISTLDNQKISYEQCMVLLDKQEQRIVDRLNSMESKIDKLFDRITK